MKKFFTKGLMALLPLVLTAVILYLAVEFLYGNVGVPIGEGLKWIAERWAGLKPPAESPNGRLAADDEWSWFFRWGAPLVGFCVAILLTVGMGFLVATFLGGKAYKILEGLLSRLPLVRTIYPYARQFTDFFFSHDQKTSDFKHAVAVPFPTRGIYSIGFVTGCGMAALNDATGRSMVSVFVPTSPTPFTGYVVFVPQEEVIRLPITVEEAMRIIISAGVLNPSAPGTAGAGQRPVQLPEEVARALPKPPGKAV